MKISLLTFVIVLSLSLFSQDTLTVMQYNLLNYGNYTSYCTESNNNIDDKDGYIRTIVDYVNPDIICVNEMAKATIIHQRFLDNILNASGNSNYSKADFIKVADSYLVNMMYYNNRKLAFHSHTIAQSFIRDIDVYTLYYKSNDLINGDTAFVTMIVAHLKAGSDYGATRLVMVENAMDYIQNHPEIKNSMFMGDFNVYSGSEDAYQELINNANTDISFNDPINQTGSWNNNYDYRYIHTQSTHTTSEGCASTGGMDDRFDFILISNDIKNVSNHVKYINGSYRTLGQDGLHFNSSLISSPENVSVPTNVLAALYGNSDHLPVILKLNVDKTLGTNNICYTPISRISFCNPVNSSLDINLVSSKNDKYTINIFSCDGRHLKQIHKNIINGNNDLQISTIDLVNGLYLLNIIDSEGNHVTRKFVKTN